MTLLLWMGGTILFWGVSVFLEKLAVQYFAPSFLLLARNSAMLAFLIPLVWMQRHQLFFNQPSLFAWSLIFLIAVCLVLAVLSLYYALRIADASVVVPATATYPVVTALLAMAFLGEQLTLVRLVGILLAMAGVALVTR